MKNVLFLGLAMVLSATALAGNNNNSKELEGRSFDVQLTDKDMIKGSKPIDDHLSFSGGKLISTYLQNDLKYGLDLTYTAIKHGDSIAFEAKGHSKSKGDVTWNGFVQTGSRHIVSGTMIWLRKGDKSLRMEFAGIDGQMPQP